MVIAIGLVIGFSIGCTGVGGGVLTAPALVLLMGFSPRASVNTALIFSALVKLCVSGMYLFQRQVDFRVLAYLLGGGIPGVIGGAVLLESLKNSKSEKWILTAIGLIISASALSSLVMSFRSRREKTARLYVLPPFALAIGLETGFSSAGAGALGSILLLNFTALAPIAIVGTDLWFGLITSATGGTIHALVGGGNWSILAKLVPAGIIGSLAGAAISRKLPSNSLRIAVLACATLVGILLIVRSILSAV
jgi:uncharacterized membrane protein YfcA